ncbi:hypothetical protein RirG_123270 [Rhizophagus irregularis DAOM 197198w]|uniref:Uncharacterized protein n=1 Tax=Rhizophagus irregularis (strain DAOM 197198w) TaxID=1432141 RepID=A0A015MHY8_RHIIW|nr:hypothetical protein RirG_123270 [Rhizophagus irregularis DAOM 197198w]
MAPNTVEISFFTIPSVCLSPLSALNHTPSIRIGTEPLLAVTLSLFFPISINLWRNQTAAQITEFLVALNSQSKQADMLKMRLKKAQLTLNITSCILMTDPDVTVPNKMLNNHAYNVIRKAHDYLFKIHPLVESEKWNIPIIGPDVRNFVYQQASELQKKDKEFIIRKAAALSIHGALQLLNHDASNTITWQQICDINK